MIDSTHLVDDGRTDKSLPAPAPLGRAEWFDRKSELLVGMLSPKGRRLLESDHRGLLKHPKLHAATTVAWIGAHYAMAWSMDELIAHLVEHWSPKGRRKVDAVLEEVVTKACEGVKGFQVPFGDYWDHTEVFASLLHYYLQCSLSSGVSRSELDDELSQRWALGTPETKSQLLDQAEIQAVEFDLHSVAESTDPEGDNLGKRLQREPVVSFIEANLSLFPEELLERRDLTEMARFRIGATYLMQELKGRKDAEAEKVNRLIQKAEERLDASLSGLSWYEHGILKQLSKKDRLARECLESHRHHVNIFDDGYFPLPEFRGGKGEFPSWVLEYVFSKGGRNYHHAAGPIPHILTTQDNLEYQVSDKFAAVVHEVPGNELELDIYRSVDGEDVGFTLFYNLDSGPDVRELMLLAHTGRARIDFAVLQADSTLKLCDSTSMPFRKEVLDRIKEIAIGAYERLLEEDRKEGSPVIRVRTAEEVAQMHRDQFMSCENAKSEKLFMELGDFSKDRRSGTVGQSAAERAYVARQSELLRAREKLVEAKRRDRTANSRDDLNGLEGEVQRALEYVRGEAHRKSQGQSKVPERELVKVMIDDRRCFVHLKITEHRRLEATWVRHDKEAPLWGEIEFDRLNLEKVASLAERWFKAVDLGARERALSGILRLLEKGFARPLQKALTALGVKHVVLSPIAFFELLPLHAASLGRKRTLCDAFDSFTYAPSLKILHSLHVMGPIQVRSCLGASVSGKTSIQNVHREMSLLKRVFPGTLLLSEPRATPQTVLQKAARASIVHLACHGSYDLDDPYASGLQLRGSGQDDGWLSAARVLRDGRFDGAKLVTLAACETGQSFNSYLTRQEYSGFDGAFLARGARCVVSSLWRVHDLASILFMTMFYVRLQQGLETGVAFAEATRFLRTRGYRSKSIPSDVVEALDSCFPVWRDAVERCIYDFARPYFWAAFKCNGLSWTSSGSSSNTSQRK